MSSIQWSGWNSLFNNDPDDYRQITSGTEEYCIRRDVMMECEITQRKHWEIEDTSNPLVLSPE